ncbi:MAG: NUDIX domain-containing protein [Candidatus Magasanikbacteria bacterium]|uniref:Nudix hydrolase domain-containing protein n=1 Tax=Candidatus Magasanikbacteria bacterium CG10_big_fil_rev_8_21_14_0_10_38_6 TaxID=1974647 RepID=A0A2M6P263_9BACT|nr:NUDIX domain-containing protein [Candidatus Magasanikbacteria bacterium]NCS71736.1 NUDIX domain-containing protein [Candidatus Magasanikbacteria bacterium]PIR77639.1 MAG: hypothetical protein COU30_01330 [Candidatus Magasanikbacteria bacterium CG10_big_fil_rev_8_21_14_0_10_38_6]
MNDQVKVSTGVVIHNSQGDIFMARCPKWSNYWTIPGGGLEYGETIADCAKREAKEETGLDITDIHFDKTVEAIFPEKCKEKKHFIFLNIFARVIDDTQPVTLNDEFEEYEWLTPEEAIKRVGNEFTKNLITDFVKWYEKN